MFYVLKNESNNALILGLLKLIWNLTTSYENPSVKNSYMKWNQIWKMTSFHMKCIFHMKPLAKSIFHMSFGGCAPNPRGSLFGPHGSLRHVVQEALYAIWYCRNQRYEDRAQEREDQSCSDWRLWSTHLLRRNRVCFWPVEKVLQSPTRTAEWYPSYCSSSVESRDTWN